MKKISKNKIHILLISLFITLVFCFPFFSGMINIGSDTCFHMNRIVALKSAIQNGDFYPYILFDQNYLFGYGSPMFYCILFLYPAALLNFIFPIAITWKIYIALIVFFSSISIQWAFLHFVEKPSFSSKITVSALYLLNFLVLTRAFKRGAIGELLALIFMPVVLVNIKKIIYEDKKDWKSLGLSFSLLLFAHNISFALYVIIFAVLIALNYKKIIENKIYIPIIKGTVFALLLCLFFILPMIEQLQSGIYNVNEYYKIRMEGISVYDLVSPSMSSFGGYHESSLLIASFVLPLFLIKDKNNRWLTIIGLVLVICATKIIPWNYIPVISFIQFTPRLINAALPFLSIASGIALNSFVHYKKVEKLIIVSSVILSIVVTIHGLYTLRYKLTGSIYDTTSNWDITDCDTLTGSHDYYNTLECSTPEYLPAYSFNYYDFQSQMYAYSNTNVYSMTGYKYNSMEHTITVTEDDYNIIYPKTYYKGYVIDIYCDNNQPDTTINAELGQYAFLSVDIPSSYAGKTVKTVIRYEGTTVQKISLLVSLITLIVSLFFKSGNNRCS